MMENQTNGTKQKIREAALELFSQRGFTAVSIRDISGKVGIKESTIYYYFKNKQSIFDDLLEDFKALTSSVRNDFDSGFSKAAMVGEQSFITVGLAFLNNYLCNKKIVRLLRMLMIEQAVNREAEVLLHRVLFDDPIRQNEAVFEAMISHGWLKKQDPKAMAVEYYAPILLVFQRYFLTDGATPENKKEAAETVTAHLLNFYQRYAVERKEG